MGRRRGNPSDPLTNPGDCVGSEVVSGCALVEQLRAVAVERCSAPQGNLGPVVSHQILDVLAMITGMP